ncbi:MAG: hypothetical protein QOG16_351 [Actinomycetota bacterium]|nr:hypothetical protein [Actinomycetota bacterium]
MLACGVLVAIGVVMIVAWGDEQIQALPEAEGTAEGKLPLRPVMKRYLWRVALVLGCGAGAGILIAGPGGRLVMRLLAATSPQAAQGRITEADEIVGRISMNGTIGFVAFVGIYFGLMIGIFYLLIHRWLPRGRLGGVVFGLLLLVWFGVTADPLRPDNPDFEIVGPGWVAVVAFSAVVVFHGMLVAAIAGRYSRSLPIISKDRRTILLYAPLLLLVPGFVLVIGVVIGAAVALVFNEVPAIGRIWNSSRVTIAGRAVAIGATLISLPIFVFGIAEIIEKSPN